MVPNYHNSFHEHTLRSDRHKYRSQHRSVTKSHHRGTRAVPLLYNIKHEGWRVVLHLLPNYSHKQNILLRQTFLQTKNAFQSFRPSPVFIHRFAENYHVEEADLFAKEQTQLKQTTIKSRSCFHCE